MLHGFGNPDECGEFRTVFWMMSAEILRAMNSPTKPPGVLAPDPARQSGIRSMVAKVLDTQDHTIDRPGEREIIELLIDGVSNYAQSAIDQVEELRKVLARTESMKLAAGVEHVRKPGGKS